jgi:uncharacterized BrkB/YihY/UPF0761 family membrane protein
MARDQHVASASETRWQSLLPGAVVVGAALAAIHAFVGIGLVSYLKSKQATYGVLGLAAGLLLTLYVLGFAVAAGAALNAEIAARKANPTPSPAPTGIEPNPMTP